MLSMNLEKAELKMPIEVVDIDVNPEIASDYGIRSVPTLVMLNENVEVKRLIGNKPTKELQEWAQND
jgi:thioredoxin 1